MTDTRFRFTLDPEGGDFRVHAANCRDLQDPRYQHDNGVMDLEATTAEGIAAEVNQDFIEEGSMAADAATDNVHFLPCAGL